MRRRSTILIFAATMGLHAEIVDRVAASVGAHVITDSEVLEEIRVTHFIEGLPAAFSADERRTTLDRLIDQELIRRMIGFTRFPLPSESDVRPLYQQVRGRYASDSEYQAALASFQLTDADIRQHLQWQLTTLRFIEYRFQPGVQVNDREIQREYDSFVKRWHSEKNTEPAPLNEVRDSLEQIVRQRLVDSALDRWLGEMRAQTTILYRKGYEQ